MLWWHGSRVRKRSAGLAAGVVVLLAACGCVERRYTIRTNPPGALAIVNGEEIGPTPVSRSFTYYAPRRITLIADGYQTEDIIQPIEAPWWDNKLTEFFTENFVPWTIRDEREFTYTMQPLAPVPAEDVEARAEDLRRRGQFPPPEQRRGILGWLGF